MLNLLGKPWRRWRRNIKMHKNMTETVQSKVEWRASVVTIIKLSDVQKRESRIWVHSRVC